MTRARRIRLYVALAILLPTAGLALQHHRDAQCAAIEAGSHWNADDLTCENGRR